MTTSRSGASTSHHSSRFALEAALQQHAMGRLAEAQALYQQVLRMAPNHPDAPRIRFNWALALQAQGRVDDAIEQYEQALSLDPGLAEAHLNCGGLLKAQGKLAQAVQHYAAALERRPQFAEAHANLGNALYAQGKLDAAVESLRKALAIRPRYADALVNLGNARFAQSAHEEAIACYRDALAIDADDVEALCGVASVLLAQESAGEALDMAARALRLRETNDAKALIVACLKHGVAIDSPPDIRGLVIRAMSEPWCRPTDLVATDVALLHADAAVGACIERATAAWPVRLSADELFGAQFDGVSDDELLRCLLENAPACGVALERFLTMARSVLLDIAGGAQAELTSGSALAFWCALARQCFVNEHVYECARDEARRAAALRDRASAMMQGGEPIPPLIVAAVAAYFPLGSLPDAETLLDRAWPQPVASLLVQQIAEPLRERELHAAIASLTAIDDATSSRVQQQYEENPYPRWVKCPRDVQRTTIDAMLARKFSWSPPQLEHAGGVDILVAGCGSGLQAIETAQALIGARVFAVDLSRASLAYAARKTREAGLENIEYAHADILKLDSIGRMFDVVYADGVLHHLADPIAGWRTLLALLRPGGLMHVSLYSESARAHVVAARELIASRGYRPTADDIRACRQELIAAAPASALEPLLESADFFVTSGCRDLLFHVQELRFTLPRIRDCLAELGLRFIGFDVQAAVLRTFRQRFQDEGAIADLDCWHRFETEFPRTFRTMYQFWAQKPAR